MVVLWHDRKETAIGHDDTSRRAGQGSDSPHQGDVRLSIGRGSNQARITDNSQARATRATPPKKDSAFLPSRERRRASCLGLGDTRHKGQPA